MDNQIKNPSDSKGFVSIVGRPENNQPYDNQVGGSHYQQFEIQPLEFLMANKDLIDYPEGNAIKYICRHKLKNGKEDIKKAIHYLRVILEEEYGSDDE